MKKFTRWALALGLCLTLLVCAALAEEAPTIRVQLDGQDLAFTDAVPQVKDQRTFLPFRAVFEAMGAQVDYEGSVITAVRGDRSLTMTLEQTVATLTDGDKTASIKMDVAPYVDSATWRTYVPVRFAAQAFGCAVGWDQDAQTAIVIDIDKLVSDAMEGKDFTYLEKLAALNEKYNEGIWDMTATFDADVSVMTVPMLTMNGDVQGAVQDSDKMSMDMNMKMDMSGMAATMDRQFTAEEQTAMDALKTDGVQVAMRGDLATGKLYMNMDLGPLAQQAQMDPGTWYDLDMTALMAQTGAEVDWAALMAQSKNMSYLDMVKSIFSANAPNDAAKDYAQVKAAADSLAVALSNEGFVLEDGQHVSTYTLKTGGTDLNVSLSLELDGETLKGYGLEFDYSGIVQGQATKMGMDMSMNDKDEMTARMSMDMGGLMDMTMTMEGAYAPGTTAPVVTPPEGATVVDYVETLQAMKGTDTGVIGGADGPTVTIAAD